MDLLELQQRANRLVDRVNNYEATTTGNVIDETTVLNNHVYADLYTLRAVFNMLFGKTVGEQINRTLSIPTDLELISSSAPANNTYFNINTLETTTTSHPFIQNLDMMNNYNMLQLDRTINNKVSREDRIKLGINYNYSANIQDAIVTESQVANIFKWNTTDSNDINSPTVISASTTPGIVLYYLGNDYNSKYTATIPIPKGSKLNSISYSTPPLYGAYYNRDESISEVGEQMGAECCRIFIPGLTYTGGKLISPIQIWQPDQRVGDDNINYGYNWQGQAIYHELVFKDKRQDISEYDGFIEADSDTIDNDPQGLAIRLALAHQKDYYKNRPFFKELEELSETDSQFIVNNILTETTRELSDEEFFKTYKLDYNSYKNIVQGDYMSSSEYDDLLSKINVLNQKVNEIQVPSIDTSQFALRDFSNLTTANKNSMNELSAPDLSSAVTLQNTGHYVNAPGWIQIHYYSNGYGAVAYVNNVAVYNGGIAGTTSYPITGDIWLRVNSGDYISGDGQGGNSTVTINFYNMRNR